nr:MAG TPA: hypothetical protein [Caudoviricetes sp.]DAX32156.1 MAG TPA: hypothetical protein [Caudoviricetes sp.]
MFSKVSKAFYTTELLHPVSVIFLYLKFESFTAIIKFSMMNQ